jgi:hypothetical protein
MTHNSGFKLVKRRRLVKLGRAQKKQVPAPPSFWDSIDKLRKDVYAISKVRLTTAHILREGGRRYVLSLRAQLNKTKAGRFHARQRKPIDMGQ